MDIFLSPDIGVVAIHRVYHHGPPRRCREKLCESPAVPYFRVVESQIVA